MKRSTNKATASTKKSTPKSASTAHFDFELVKQFTDFMRLNDLVELDLRSGDREIRLRRNGVLTTVPASGPMAQVITPAPVSTAPSAEPAAASTPSKKYSVVTSPFVGTFYRSAGPNQDPFVEEGKTVNAGDTLCIVEAMKLMNEIESDYKGRIVKILVTNGTPVEFGEPLFEIDPL